MSQAKRCESPSIRGRVNGNQSGSANRGNHGGRGRGGRGHFDHASKSRGRGNSNQRGGPGNRGQHAGRGRVGQDNSDRRRSIYPMTFHQLRKLEEGQPNDMLLTMLSPKSGFRELLVSLKGVEDSCDKVLQILAKTVQSSFSPQNLLCLLQMILQTNFLMGPVGNLLISKPTVRNIIEDLIQVIICFQEKLPTQSLLVVTFLLPQIRFALTRDYGEDLPLIIKTLVDDIEEQMTLIQKQFQRGDLLRDQGRTQQEPDAPGDFRKLSVIPSSKDIQPELKPFIRKNRVFGSYKSTDEYLDVQFRLLREDCIRPLREGIKEYRKKKNRGENKRLQDIRVYENARILEPYCGRKGVIHLIEFNVTKLKKVRWETTERLIAGSLLCFSKDDFKTALFGTIVKRNVNDLQEGFLFVQFEGLNIQLLEANPYEEYVMVESGAYFESYVHNLEGLKDFNSITLPFQKYLLCSDEEISVHAPRYLLNKPTTYDFSSIVVDKKRARRYSTVNPLDLKAWPSREEMGLDPSQYQAVQTAITKEYSVIQGPPGTGKTFIGLKICHVLLENKNVWLPNQHSRPILVVCYTNHALDQFLEGILQFMSTKDTTGVPQLARLGGRMSSENEKLKECLLQNIKQKTAYYDDLDAGVRRHELKGMIRQDIENIEAQIEQLTKQIKTARTAIIQELYLEHLMTPNQKMSLYSRQIPEGNFIREWLLEGLQTKEQILTILDIDKQRRLAFGQQEALLTLQQLVLAERKGNSNNNEEGWIKVRRKQDIRDLKQHLNSKDCMSEAEANAVRDVWRRSIADRWRLYHYWMAKYCEDKMIRMRTLHGQHEALARRLGELLDEEDYRILRHCAVIGMTTTGAAKYRRLVKRIAPLIVIVEEAAEVLEAHIITSLNQACQHFILIGDHQQLRPNPTVYKLATEYNLNISLFERMVRNKMHCDTLRIQHRMRPEIAELIVPHIYDNLENHESVLKYEKIKGVKANLFFITHTMKERSQEDTRSHSNDHEAKYVTALYDYFLKQGYESSQVTILTLYAGQMFAIRQLLKRKNLESTRVTSVDNFQGEENDIILLSLVRSNEFGSIGFLKISNRVCVALSRAKKGFFVIGNMTQMQEQSHLWNNIIESLRQKNRVVEALPLACQNHPETITQAKSAEDFKKAPEGGCMEPCDFRLDCGHVCSHRCHPVDPEHAEYTCIKPCSRRCKTNGQDGHLCRKNCFESCGLCRESVVKEIPVCGHKQIVPCYQDPATFSCQEICRKPCTTNEEDRHPCKKRCFKKCGDCREKVAKEIPMCGHTQAVPCYQDPKDFQCQMTCNKPCTTNGEDAHLCKKACSQACGNCTQKVRKTIPSCGHFQLVPCYQNPTEFSCQLPCERKPYSCDHKCPKLCGEKCPEKCTTKCIKVMPCGHEMKTECFKKPSELKCQEKIDRELPCGHTVKEVCSKDLSEYKCHKKVSAELECGHKVTTTCHQKETGRAKEFKCQVKVQYKCQINDTHNYTAACYDYSRSFFGCKAQCDAKLPCGHTCHGKCGDCLGQHHPPCTAVCGKQLPCLHRCKSKCGEPCKPCQESCSTSCFHMVCNRKCGQKCTPCHKECIWSCPHHTCNKRCGEECDREPCNEPCPLFMPCGHQCLGFCGEPCPLVCYFCNGSYLQQTLRGIRFTQHTRLVKVFPCCHVVESNTLEAWFEKCVVQDVPHVCGFLTCPLCSQQVSYCPRFGNILKGNAKEHQRIRGKLQKREMEYNNEIEKFKKRMLFVVGPATESSDNAAKDEKKQHRAEANWFLNPQSLVSHLMEIQLSSLSRNGTNGPNLNHAYSGIMYLYKLHWMNEKDRSVPIRCKDLEYLLSCALYFYKLSHEIKDIKSIMEVLFSIFSGIPLKSTPASLLLKNAVTGKDWQEKLKDLEIDEMDKVGEIWRQHIEGAIWVACAKGHVWLENRKDVGQVGFGQARENTVCLDCLTGKPADEETSIAERRVPDFVPRIVPFLRRERGRGIRGASPRNNEPRGYQHPGGRGRGRGGTGGYGRGARGRGRGRGGIF